MHRILIIDDEKSFQMMLKANFAIRGYQVDTTTLGKEGLRMARLQRPDLIMLDLKLPDIPGWDVLDELKNDVELKDIPVIVMTASVDKPPETGTRSEQISYFITKPFAINDLMQQVKIILGE